MGLRYKAHSPGRSRGDDAIDCTLHVLGEGTALAWKCSTNGYEGKYLVWLPRSQVEMLEENEREGTAVFRIPGWLAEEKGLEND